MFLSKARAYPSEESIKYFTLVYASDLMYKHSTGPEKPAKNKHSSLLQTFVNYKCKKFFNIGPKSRMLLTMT